MQQLQSADVQYAGPWRRGAALILDFILLSLVFFPVTRWTKGVWIMRAGEHRWDYGWLITDPLCLAFLAVIVLYFVLLEGWFGATAGKKALRLRVARADGRRPGIGPALVRNLLRAVDALPAFNILGVVLILRSAERARFGDRVAGTRVLVDRPKSADIN